MASVYLMASFAGQYDPAMVILGNPEAESVTTPTGAYPGSPNLTISPINGYRLLSIVTDVEILVLQVKNGQTTSTPTGVATRVPNPSSVSVSYVCLIAPDTTGIYVKTP